MNTTTREKVRRYIVIHEQSNRIVATCGGTHAIMEKVCERLDRERPGTHLYDDASEAPSYTPQDGPNLALSVR
jgi:hypothetical protein